MVQQVITYYWRIAGYETVSKPSEPIQTSSSHDDDSDDMRNLSALVSTFQTPDGDKVGLDSFVLSRVSIDRRRQNDRQVISLQAKLEFLENLPEHLVYLGWKNY